MTEYEGVDRVNSLLAKKDTLENYQASAQSDAVLVDCQQLQSLEQVMGAETVAEIANLFVIEARNSLAEILEAFESNSFAQIASISHATKSGAGTLGCSILADIFKEMEMQAKDEQADELAALIPCLQDLMENSLQELMQTIQSF